MKVYGKVDNRIYCILLIDKLYTAKKIEYLNGKFYGMIKLELLWPSGYELQLSLKRSQVLILVKVIGGQQEGHLVQKCSLLQQSPN